MKVKIIQSGVFQISGITQKELKIGTILTLKTDALPAYLVGKVSVLGKGGVRVRNETGAHS